MGLDWLSELRIQSQSDDVRRHLREASHERDLGTDPERQDYITPSVPVTGVARLAGAAAMTAAGVKPAGTVQAAKPDCGERMPRTAHQAT